MDWRIADILFVAWFALEVPGPGLGTSPGWGPVWVGAHMGPKDRVLSKKLLILMKIIKLLIKYKSRKT